MPVAVTTVSSAAATKPSLPSCPSKDGRQSPAWWKKPARAMSGVVIESYQAPLNHGVTKSPHPISHAWCRIIAATLFISHFALGERRSLT
eukprot:2646499-Ditylum_brightwellii.AAC.1